MAFDEEKHTKDYFERFPPKKNDLKLKAEKNKCRREMYHQKYKNDPVVKRKRAERAQDPEVKRKRAERYQVPEVKRKQAERYQKCKQLRLDAQVFNFDEDRNEDELTRKAQGMADELSGKMHPNINDDDLWYIGGACTRRMLVDVVEGVVTPRGAISDSEIVQWFFRDNTMVRKKDGSKLKRDDIFDLINSGELLICVVDADANPKVCDSAEGLAQVATIKRFPDESVIRTIAAGTVARGSYVERDGYGLYGWVLKGAKNNTRFVVGTYSLRGMSVESVRDTIRIGNGNQNTTISEILTEMPTIIVRLQHQGEGAKRIYISEVRGSVHICTYGLPGREDKWVVRVMSFGVGGELAAIASHKAILRKKQCKSYIERRGAYTELVGDEQFVGSGSSLHEQASEEEYLERIEFSLMTNSIQDEDVDDEYDENEE